MLNAKYKILSTKIKYLGIIKICMLGTSMLPELRPKDLISVQCNKQYFLGDIIVFCYKNEELLVHRIVKINDNRYYCKGDNSFRLEDIDNTQIVGKVISYYRSGVNHIVKTTDLDFVSKSYQLGCKFKEVGYDKKKLVLTDIYNQYYNEYIHI